MSFHPLEPESNTQTPRDANSNGLAVLPDVGESGILDTQRHISGTPRPLDILGQLFGPLDENISDWTRTFFNGSWGPKREDLELCERANRAIELGALSVKQAKIHQASIPSERARRVINHPWGQFGRSPRESEHQLIKYSCLLWLESLGIQAIGCEVRCGSTPPRRLAAIGNGLDAIILVPYGSDPDELALDAYLFSLGEGWQPARHPEQIFLGAVNAVNAVNDGAADSPTALALEG